jgi:Zn finger protein HypA/HybF involved in hydrogenase expression
MNNKIAATWDISLDTECPNCEHYFDLADGDDFWVDCSFEACEHGTLATKDFEVTCPECNHEFKVDFYY